MPTPHKVRINPAGLGPARPTGSVPGPGSVRLAHLADMTTPNTVRTALGNTADHTTGNADGKTAGKTAGGAGILEPAVSLKELAAELHVTCQTLYDLRSQGRGPRGFRVGRQLRFRRSEIQNWLEWLEAEDTHCHHDAAPGR